MCWTHFYFQRPLQPIFTRRQNHAKEHLRVTHTCGNKRHLYNCEFHGSRFYLPFIHFTGSEDWNMGFLSYWTGQRTNNTSNKNCIYEEINNRLNWRNACYHSVQSLLPSRLVPKHVKIKMYLLFCMDVKPALSY